MGACKRCHRLQKEVDKLQKSLDLIQQLCEGESVQAKRQISTYQPTAKFAYHKGRYEMAGTILKIFGDKLPAFVGKNPFGISWGKF